MIETTTPTEEKERGLKEYTVQEILAHRRSPKGFVEMPIEPEQMRLLLEAARWAPSSRNEQPWRFIVATKEAPAEFDKLLGMLTDSNKAWAHRASALIAVVAKLNWDKDGSANRHALYDAGGAAANLTVQAVALGLQVHQMAGFSVRALREAYNVPSDYEPLVVAAIGYGDDSLLEQRQRVRKEISGLVFRNEWGKSFTLTNQ